MTVLIKQTSSLQSIGKCGSRVVCHGAQRHTVVCLDHAHLGERFLDGDGVDLAKEGIDELLSGAGGNTATKTEQAERLILDLLADGKELASEDIEKAATEAGISARTVRAAKRNLDGRITSKRIGAAWYHALKK